MNHEQLIVYRSGGLGDFIKTWPTLRQNTNATIVTNQERGTLAHAILGIKFRDIKQWLLCFKGQAGPPDYSSTYNHLVVYRHNFHSPEDEKLEKNIKSVAANISIEFRDFQPNHCVGHDPSPYLYSSRGPLFHVGAGRLIFGKDGVPQYYPGKAWDITRSITFTKQLQKLNHDICLIAGPAQRHAWDHVDELAFSNAGGVFCDSLFELTSRILTSSFFIGFDSGPTHLAAQLGKPTIALFGPTGSKGIRINSDLYYAEPLGPVVKIIKPDDNVPIEQKPRLRWLDPINAANLVHNAYYELINMYRDSIHLTLPPLAG